MKKRQPPLLDPSSGGNLPSPLFAGRPGWGGQLRTWLSENAYVVTFRMVLGIAMTLVVISIVRNRPVQVAVEEIPTPTPTVESHSITARPGEGLSNLAARALDQHLAKHPEHHLSAGAHLYAVDTLSRQALAIQSHSAFILKVGQEVSFPHTAIEAAIKDFAALTPGQQAAWTRLAR